MYLFRKELELGWLAKVLIKIKSLQKKTKGNNENKKGKRKSEEFQKEQKKYSNFDENSNVIQCKKASSDTF